MKRNGTGVEIRGPGGTLTVPPGDGAAQDLAMLIEGETSGRPLDEVLASYGRSRSTYYEKLRRFLEGGVAALSPRPPGPRSPWRRTYETVRLIVTSRLRNPQRSAVAIAADLQAQGVEVSVRTVERTLQEFDLSRLPGGHSPGGRP